MILASELAGFFAAHAVWSVSDGTPLIPMLAYTTGDGERKMERCSDHMHNAYLHDREGECRGDRVGQSGEAIAATVAYSPTSRTSST